MEAMGRRGIQEAAHQCLQKASYTAKQIGALKGFSLPFTGPFFNEFVVRGPIDSVELLSRLAKEKEIEGGIALSRFMPDREKDFLVCVTETNTREQIDSLVAALSTL
jgi:glycine dehydrogenase subunit 1